MLPSYDHADKVKRSLGIAMEEKRRHVRIKTENLLSYEGVDENGNRTERGMGKTLDISQGGLLMETPLPVISKYILLMSLDIKEELIKVKAKVVYSREAELKKFHTGVQFIEPHKKIRQTVAEMIRVFNLQKNKTVNQF